MDKLPSWVGKPLVMAWMTPIMNYAFPREEEAVKILQSYLRANDIIGRYFNPFLITTEGYALNEDTRTPRTYVDIRLEKHFKKLISLEEALKTGDQGPDIPFKLKGKPYTITTNNKIMYIKELKDLAAKNNLSLGKTGIIATPKTDEQLREDMLTRLTNESGHIAEPYYYD